MAKSTALLLDALNSIAHSQAGYFTAAQATKAGVDRAAIHRLTNSGFLEREQRGLYRLSHFPRDENAELWGALLWAVLDKTSGTPAVLCYGTALSLYDVSTINPKSIDIGVPRDVRFRRAIPSSIQLHRMTYPVEDITSIKGLPTTTLFRTIADLIATGKGLQFVDEALKVASSRALVTSRENEILAGMRALDHRAVSFLRV